LAESCDLPSGVLSEDPAREESATVRRPGGETVPPVMLRFGERVPKWYLTRNGPRSIERVIAVGSQGADCFSNVAVRGWRWIPLQGPTDKYFVDVAPLEGRQKAWLLLVLFDSAARHIMESMSAIKAVNLAQLPLIRG